MKVLVLIPAYNEELTIGSVVILSKKYGDVLVIDDGSSDRTSEIAREGGAIVIRNEYNMGKAYALVRGFEYALSKDYDIVVTLDADGQHDPDEIPLLIDPIIRGNADFVIGSRYLNGSKKRIPFYRRIGLWILNKGTKVVSNLEVDSQSGFRAMSKRVIEKSNLNSDGYSIETDMIVNASEHGFKLIEVPINVRYDVPNRHKKNPLSHGLSVLASIVGFIGYRKPMLLFSLLSLVSFFVAGILTYLGMKPYYTTGHVFMTQMIGAGIFFIIGIQLFVAGLTLNVLAKMVRK